jgi:hypothetical protein
MSESAFSDTPVAFLVFNRPDVTKVSLAAIRRARPRRLLVVADGPRASRPGEDARCKAVRDLIVNGIDWPCELQTNFADENMGCGRRVSSGLDWVFQQVDRAIVVEDDCVPSDSFFPYCARMLEQWKDDPRVMHVGGSNYQNGIRRGPYAYYFSRYNHIWGWATWRRAWAKYDFSMQSWSAFDGGGFLEQEFEDEVEVRFWRTYFSRIAAGKVDTWDAQWMYAVMAHRGLAITPNTNLVQNVGFGADATHTYSGTDAEQQPARDFAEVAGLGDPLFVVRHREADWYTFQHMFGGRLLRGAGRFFLPAYWRMKAGRLRRILMGGGAL